MSGRLQLFGLPRLLYEVKRDSFLWLAGDRAPQGLGIVGIESRIVTGAADRYIELFSVD
jgi:hypothetical protein